VNQSLCHSFLVEIFTKSLHREDKFSVPLKDKVADEKKLVQRDKFETMTIGRDHQSWWLSYKEIYFYVQTNLP
jgi:hypothetical protein